jgi:hypothetical protein
VQGREGGSGAVEGNGREEGVGRGWGRFRNGVLVSEMALRRGHGMEGMRSETLQFDFPCQFRNDPERGNALRFVRKMLLSSCFAVPERCVVLLFWMIGGNEASGGTERNPP